MTLHARGASQPVKPKHKLPPWLRPKEPSEIVEVGVAWYSPDQWTLAKASSADPERFEESFQEWTAIAEAALKELRAAGIVGQPYYIRADELLAWCLAHSKPNNAASRAEFVTEKLQSTR